MSVRLTPDMFDAVSEVFNIGVGHAALALRNLTESPVDVGLPHVEILTDQDAEKEFVVAPDRFMVGTSTRFEGGFGGEALLVLPSKAAVNLCSVILPDQPGTEGEDRISTREIMEEVGNILIQACFTKIADIMDVRLGATPPIYITGMEDIRARFRAQLSDDVIWFRFSFTVDRLDVTGYIYFLMDPMHTFLHALEQLVRRTGGVER